jgi:hypothetical protein
MTERYAVVVTTINAPTPAVSQIARDAGRLEADFIIVGDSKSPADFHQAGAVYLSLEDQTRGPFAYGRTASAGHYARKNVGYLAAIARGATVIIETDDDNLPRAEFWAPRQAKVLARLCESRSWINVYRWYADAVIWPRGLPLDRIHDVPPAFDSLPLEEVYCPIQQGLADGNPDVDAIYRLVMPLPFNFLVQGPVALRGGWCPFNSQNTTIFAPAFPLLYLPYDCSFRMTDIWRSFVAQRIAYLNGWSILFHQATVVQDRNEHDLMKDFEDETPGYLNNQKIREALDATDCAPGVDAIPDAMRACYRKLQDIGVVGGREPPLLDAWLEDLQALS